jgi:hypothetical protein
MDRTSSQVHLSANCQQGVRLSSAERSTGGVGGGIPIELDDMARWNAKEYLNRCST